MNGAFAQAGRAAADRLRHGDLPQAGLLVLATMVAALALAWPARPGLPNESWYGVAQTRGALVALLAIGYGMGLATEDRRRAWGTVGAVFVVAFSALPIEMAALAATVPAVPAWWPWVMTAVAVGGQLTLGALLGAVMRRLRLVVLAPLLVPAAVAGTIALDVAAGVNLLNPLLAATRPAPGFLAAHAALALVGVVVAARAARRREAA